MDEIDGYVVPIQHGDKNVPSPLFVDKRQVDELVESGEISSVDDLKNKLALPEDKTHVVEFTVEAGTKVRTSQIGRGFEGEGGLRQFEPRSSSLLKDTDKFERSDFPGSFGPNNPINEVFDLGS